MDAGWSARCGNSPTLENLTGHARPPRPAPLGGLGAARLLQCWGLALPGPETRRAPPGAPGRVSAADAW